MESQMVAPPWGYSLYVGDLDPAVTEVDLGQVFIRIGPILSLKLCRDRISGYSLRYGYVNFYYQDHAAAAIACLNHTGLKGKPMRIMWCERDPRKRKTGDGNLFVRNLDPSVTSIHLENIFSKYGNILSCKVAEDCGKSKGFGFVQFNSVASSMAALDSLNGTMLEGKKLYVTKFLKKNERSDANEEPKFTNLFVKSMGGNLTLEFLKDNFSKFGKLRYIRIVGDAVGKSGRYGIIYFQSHDDAKEAMEALNGAQIGPGKLFVDKAKIKSEWKELRSGHKEINNYYNEKSYDTSLYVKNLHRLIGDRELKEHFGFFGKVTSAKVVRYNNGVSKGFGFVNFSTPEEANKACGAFHGSILLGRTLYAAKAEPKEERQRKLQSYYAYTHPTYKILPAYEIIYPGYIRPGLVFQSSGKSEGEMYPFATESYSQEGFTRVPVQHTWQQTGTYTTSASRYVRMEANSRTDGYKNRVSA